MTRLRTFWRDVVRGLADDDLEHSGPRRPPSTPPDVCCECGLPIVGKWVVTGVAHVLHEDGKPLSVLHWDDPSWVHWPRCPPGPVPQLIRDIG